MKKSLFAFAALAAILAGCAKEITGVDSQDTVKVTLHATVPDTKVITDNAGAFTWQAGDKVTVLNTSGEAYEFSTKAGGTAVDFSSTTFDGDLSTEAMYPASASHASGKFYLNPSFDWVADASMMPMAGTVDTDNLTASFAPVGGVLKLICFNVDKDADNLVVSSDSKQIVGEFTPSAGKITAAASDENKSVTVSFAKAEAARTMVFYIPLPTGTLGKLTFTLNNGSTKVFEKTTKGDVSFDAAGKMIVAPGLNCANDLVMWSEDFSGYSADNVPADDDIEGYGGVNNITYECKDGGSNTKIYADKLAGGSSPELLIGKSTGYFTVSNLPTNGASTLTLKYKTNAKALALSSSTEGISFSPNSTNTKEEHIIIITNSKKATSFDIKFYTTSGDNVRFDDVVLLSPSYTAPFISTEASELEIAIAAGEYNTASTTFEYTNAIDDLGISATSSADWLTASIEGNTLTVRAAKNGTGADRNGTVTLRASGVSKTVAVSQPNAKVAAPVISGVDNNNQVTLSCTVEGASIRYTTDGTDPTSTTGTVYSEAITVTSGMTLKAIAYKENWIDSAISSHEYTFKCATPTFSPGAGAVASGTKVAISTETLNATIYYTTDGSTPTTSSTVYNSTNKVAVTAACTLKAIAVRDGWQNSEVGSATYTIQATNYSVTYTQTYNSKGHTVATSGTAPSGSSCSWTTTYTNSNQLSKVEKITCFNAPVASQVLFRAKVAYEAGYFFAISN